VRPAGLLGAARLALRVALRSLAAAAAAASNPLFYVVGSNSFLVWLTDYWQLHFF
jgi:hypothetical protein